MLELSDELDDLSKLDELRDQARKLKEEGMRALAEIKNNSSPSWNGRGISQSEDGGRAPSPAGQTVTPGHSSVSDDGIEAPPITPRWQGSGGKIEAAMLARVQCKLNRVKNGSSSKLMEQLTSVSLKEDLLQLLPDLPSGAANGPARRASDAEGQPAPTRSDVDEVPVLLAARAMQALVSSAQHTFSKATMLCYYRIIREICVADSPDWNAGGARAGVGGEVTAYVTAECIRAVLMLERSIRATAGFFRETDKFYRYACFLQKVKGHVPEKWRQIEAERATLEWYVTMVQERPYLALDLPLFEPDESLIRRPDAREEACGASVDPAAEKRPDEAEPEEEEQEAQRFTLPGLMDYFTRLGAAIHDGLLLSVTAFDQAAGDIANARKVEDERAIRQAQITASAEEEEVPAIAPAAAGDTPEDRDENGPPRFVRRNSRFVRSMSAHEIAAGVIEKALRDARKMVGHCKADDGTLRNLRHLATLFEKIALEVRLLLDPAERYIASVMDHELTAATQIRPVWDARELAFAAGAYGALTQWRKDERLERAAQLLSSDISEAGLFRLGKPFHSVPSGLRWQPLHFEVCRAFSELLANVEVPVTPALIAQMIFPFTQMSIELKKTNAMEHYLLLPGKKDKLEKLRGWHMEEPPIPARPTLWVSGHAVLALDKLVRMLDQKINKIVLRYFTFKKPDQIEHKLDHLFYPDYGRELFYAPEVHPTVIDTAPEESIGITLQRMRAHIVDVKLPAAYGDTVFSAVLHGPPGTGKTTLLEALARSSDVPLIEMSPSDIAVKGEQAIEARARATFQALSMLTRVVIIFDEFEPVLQKRGTDEGSADSRSMYTFLTPGMLPKLTRLHHEANHKQTAYALVTNHLRKLDDAAIRPGRFDRHVGIYMPDPVSRSGFFMKAIAKEIERKAYEARSPAAEAGQAGAPGAPNGTPDCAAPVYDFALTADQKQRFDTIIRESGGVPPSRLAPRWLNVRGGNAGASVGGGDHVLYGKKYDSLQAFKPPEPGDKEYELMYLVEEHRLNAWEWVVQESSTPLDDLLVQPGPEIDGRYKDLDRKAKKIQDEARQKGKAAGIA